MGGQVNKDRHVEKNRLHSFRYGTQEEIKVDEDYHPKPDPKGVILTADMYYRDRIHTVYIEEAVLRRALVELNDQVNRYQDEHGLAPKLEITVTYTRQHIAHWHNRRSR